MCGRKPKLSAIRLISCVMDIDIAAGDVDIRDEKGKSAVSYPTVVATVFIAVDYIAIVAALFAFALVHRTPKAYIALGLSVVGSIAMANPLYMGSSVATGILMAAGFITLLGAAGIVYVVRKANPLLW